MTTVVPGLKLVFTMQTLQDTLRAPKDPTRFVLLVTRTWDNEHLVVHEVCTASSGKVETGVLTAAARETKDAARNPSEHVFTDEQMERANIQLRAVANARVPYGAFSARAAAAADALKDERPNAVDRAIMDQRPDWKLEPRKSHVERDPMATQRAEFDAVDDLLTAYNRIQRTPIVDDDYPEVRHGYETALYTFIMALISNGRFNLGSRGGSMLVSEGVTRAWKST